MAGALCASLAEHWISTSPAEWVPPFEGARLARVSDFTAQSAEAAIEQSLSQHSALYTLLSRYEIPAQQKVSNIVARVRREVRSNKWTEHLAPRFSRELNIGASTTPLRVDFLGQHLACYFIQVTESARGIEGSAERAFGKLFELQALRRFVKARPKSLGLFDHERPDRFELILVGDRTHPVQKHAIARIEALADQKQVIARPIASAIEAAQHIVELERKAA